jgi:hypothetical protein
LLADIPLSARRCFASTRLVYVAAGHRGRFDLFFGPHPAGLVLRLVEKAPSRPMRQLPGAPIRLEWRWWPVALCGLAGPATVYTPLWS